jgi:hypothetical protein
MDLKGAWFGFLPGASVLAVVALWHHICCYTVLPSGFVDFAA